MKHRATYDYLYITTDGGMEIGFYFTDDYVSEISSGMAFTAYPNDDDLRQWFVQIDGEFVTVQSLIEPATSLMAQERREADIESAAQEAEERSLRSQHRYL